MPPAREHAGLSLATHVDGVILTALANKTTRDEAHQLRLCAVLVLRADSSRCTSRRPDFHVRSRLHAIVDPMSALLNERPLCASDWLPSPVTTGIEAEIQLYRRMRAKRVRRRSGLGAAKSALQRRQAIIAVFRAIWVD